MLKRITIIVVILVLLKPAYEFSTSLWNDVEEFLHNNEIINQISEEPLVDLNETLDTINEATKKIPAMKDIQSKDAVQSVEELADALFYHFSNWDQEFEIHYVGSTSDIENIIEKAVQEASNRDQYILGHLADQKIEYEYGKLSATIKVQQNYLTNAQLEQYVDNQVAQILSGLDPQSMTDFEKVKFVNDYIVKNTQYSTDTVLSPHSAGAILKEGKGVCQGYALLALKMLRELGVETLYVVGEVHTGPHAWNLVKVEGNWYHLDTTWNDPLPDRGSIVGYQYFLINDTQMRLDHHWNQANYPKAQSSQFSYMTQMEHAFEKDDHIYYSNTKDDYRLYRMNIKTGENLRLTKSRAQYIVVYRDWVYFSNYSNGAHLAKIRTDGTNESIVHREQVSDLSIEDGYLIFATNNGMKKMQIS